MACSRSRLSIFNALLESVWHAGALRIDLSEQVGDTPQISAMSLDARPRRFWYPHPGAPDLLELQVGEVESRSKSRQPATGPLCNEYANGCMAFVDGQLSTTVDTEPDIRFRVAGRRWRYRAAGSNPFRDDPDRPNWALDLRTNG